jgi:hypothetical protein
MISVNATSLSVQVPHVIARAVRFSNIHILSSATTPNLGHNAEPRLLPQCSELYLNRSTTTDSATKLARPPVSHPTHQSIIRFQSMASPSAPSSKRSSEGINFLSQLVRTIAIRKADEDLEEMERGLRIFRLGATHAKDIPEPELQATSTSNTTRIGFFNLPRELRDEIYNHLWTSLPHLILSYSCAAHLKSGCDISPAATDLWSKIQRLCLPQPGTDVASADVGNDAETTVWHLRIKACYDIEPSSSEQFSSPPAGISANKQLLQEALWAFHRKGVVQFENFFQL